MQNTRVGLPDLAPEALLNMSDEGLRGCGYERIIQDGVTRVRKMLNHKRIEDMTPAEVFDGLGLNKPEVFTQMTGCKNLVSAPLIEKGRISFLAKRQDWCIAELSFEIDYSLSDIAQTNVDGTLDIGPDVFSLATQESLITDVSSIHGLSQEDADHFVNMTSNSLESLGWLRVGLIQLENGLILPVYQLLGELYYEESIPRIEKYIPANS